MKLKAEESREIKENKGLEERIQRLKYSMVYDYRIKKNHENLMMFIMDV
jgi:hypothetical protein